MPAPSISIDSSEIARSPTRVPGRCGQFACSVPAGSGRALVRATSLRPVGGGGPSTAPGVVSGSLLWQSIESMLPAAARRAGAPVLAPRPAVPSCRWGTPSRAAAPAPSAAPAGRKRAATSRTTSQSSAALESCGEAHQSRNPPRCMSSDLLEIPMGSPIPNRGTFGLNQLRWRPTTPSPA